MFSQCHHWSILYIHVRSKHPENVDVLDHLDGCLKKQFRPANGIGHIFHLAVIRTHLNYIGKLLTYQLPFLSLFKMLSND